MPGTVYTAEEKYSIIMEAFQNPNITIASICREHGIAVSLFYKWRDQFLEGGKKGLEGKDPDKALIKENENLKSIIGEMTIANEILKKKLYEEEKVSSVNEMDNSGIKIRKACYYSGINRITYYYRKNHENREDRRYLTSIDKSIVNKIIELCRERVTYGYNRIWALLRNSGIRISRKTVYRIMKNNDLTLPLHTHKNKMELKLLRADRPEMLIETDITYIPTGC